MDLARFSCLGSKEKLDQSWIDISDESWLEKLESNLRVMLEISLTEDQLELFEYYLREAKEEFKLVAKDEGYYKIPKYQLYKIKKIHDLLIDVSQKYYDNKELRELCLDITKCIHQLVRKLEVEPYKPKKYYEGNNKLYRELNMLTGIAHNIPNRGKKQEELREKATPKLIADFLVKNYRLKNKLIETLAKRLKEGKL
ncbi:hypothetical protein DRJ16_03820 [Candidatus Woesearchaeota archaeon]|nr:MAG: hypothetical protein DRJ16_03820 [Candidatus Woesearchaeota archaeon]